MQFDAKLQEVEDSSSSDEEDGEEAVESNLEPGSSMEVQGQPEYLSSVEEF